MFHLAIVVLDPYTYESSWILDTATRVLRNFAAADCRVVDAPGVIVHGIELRRFVAGANPVENFVLCGCESRERQHQQPERIQSLHSAPRLLDRVQLPLTTEIAPLR